MQKTKPLNEIVREMSKEINEKTCSNFIDVQREVVNSNISLLQAIIKELESQKKTPKYSYYHEDRVAANNEKVTIKYHNQALDTAITNLQNELKIIQEIK